jgi:hypothetical protein
VTAEKWTKDYADQREPDVHYTRRYYSGRNYNLFAILANVRNGHGFALFPTGEGFQPISEPRGLPLDVCPEVATSVKAWGVDGHSHSHLTLTELLQFNWTQETVCFGVVNGPTFREWSRWGREQGEPPKEYCGGVSGRGVKHVTPGEMENLIAAIVAEAHALVPPLEKQTVPENADYGRVPFAAYRNRTWEVERKADELVAERLKSTFCRVGWRIAYHKCAREFWSDTIPRLLRLGSPDNVRIVFFFDN